MPTEVTTWYLEMLNPAQLCFAPPPASFASPGELRIEQAKLPCPAFSRFLYTSVGGDWSWTDRLSWNDDRWLNYLDRPEVETWVAYVSGTPAGYIELEAQTGGNVEIAYFGLLRQFIGQRLGGHLLSVGVQRAWAIGSRVWVHTCSLDGQYALANYQARGFQLYRQEKHWVEIP